MGVFGMSEALRLFSLAFGFGVAFAFILIQAFRKAQTDSILELSLVLLGFLVGIVVFSRG
jgi:hypothetical protein